MFCTSRRLVLINDLIIYYFSIDKIQKGIKQFFFECKEIEILLKHLEILCNNEKEVYEYFINWIGQMVQYPERKSICITFISKEGAWKGTLMDLFRRMFGKKKILETADPLRDVFVDFNGAMKDAFLINFNEICLTDMKPTRNK